MPDLSTVLVLFTVALVGGALTGVVSLLLGGAGALIVMRGRVDRLETAVLDVDQDLQRQKKRLAADASVRSRQSAKAPSADLEAEARGLLAAGTPSGPLRPPPGRARRPSVI